MTMAPALPRVARRRLSACRLAEGVLVYGLALAAGQVIFWGWGAPHWRPLANAYWQFLFVAWAGMRLGLAGTLGLLGLVAAQAGWGMLQRLGFFAQDLRASGGLSYGAYIVILSLVGLALASYMAVLRRQRADARIAAIAFECQEGLLITDERGRILRANQSFLAMSGYAAHELLGRTPHFLRAMAGAQQQGDDAPPWPALQRREWHRRKSGQRYPVWLTCTPVANPRGRVTHHVLTCTDISDWGRQQAQRRRREQTQREALVREVHHRIKNNLQGITGLLQTLGQRYPALQEPVAEVTGQVRSIAVLHGLQGRSRAEQVRLCELVQEVACGVGALWGVDIAVHAPQEDGAPGLPCHIQSAEAVPLALIVHELMLNAVKHGGRQHRDVQVSLDLQGQQACLTISNPGHWPAQVADAQLGLELVATLMPRAGAVLTLEQVGGRAVARLRLQAPVLQPGLARATQESHGH